MPIIYKIDYPNADRPIRQEVEKAGFPHPDADGETQCVNTHFCDEGEAWDQLLRELDAEISSYTKNLMRAMERLQTAKDQLAEVAVRLERAKQGRDEFISSCG